MLLALCFDMHVFYKNLIVLYHSDNFLFRHLYQIHTLNNNLNEERMINLTGYVNFFMVKMLQLLCYNFFNNNRENLAKQVTRKDHSVIAKFRILKG